MPTRWMSSVKRIVTLYGLQATLLVAGSAVALHVGGRQSYVAPEHVFARVLAKDPGERYASAGAT